MTNFLLVLLGVVLNTGAQVALKLGTAGLGHVTLSDLIAKPMAFIGNGWVWLGLVLYAVSVVNWFIVLSRWEVSIAYALMSLGYVALFIVGVWRFGEPVTTLRVAGLVLIVAGVILITRPVPTTTPAVPTPEGAAPHA